MFSKRKIILIFLVSLGVVVSAEDCVSQGRQNQQKNIKYHYRVSRLPTPAPDTTLLRLNIAIPYKGLIFIAKDSGYFAGIKFNIFVTDDDNNTVYDYGWQKKIEVNNYSLTNSDSALQQFTTSTKLPAGKYKVVMEAIDENIKIPEYNEFEVKILDYSSKKFVIGDMLLFDGIHDFLENSFGNLNPAPTNVCRNDFTLFTQVFLLDSTVNLKYEINWYDNNRKAFKDPVIVFKNGKMLTLFQSYSIKETPHGRYDVQFRVFGKGAKSNSTELTLEVIKNVDYFSEESIDIAIEQMNYIGEGEVWDSLKNAEVIDEKKYFFKRFWSNYYQAPDSSKNPVREEYFRRVRHTNRVFNEGVDGWRTDRGRIFILYGPPSDVERTTDNMMRRIEIWTYQNVERQYVFVDVNGNGSFRLIRIN